MTSVSASSRNSLLRFDELLTRNMCSALLFFLLLEEIVRLDTAMSDREAREFFLQGLKSEQGHPDTEMLVTSAIDCSLLKWTIMKDMIKWQLVNETNMKRLLSKFLIDGMKDLVTQLVRNNPIMNILLEDEFGCASSALILASRQGYVGVVRIFISRGEQVNRGDEFGRTALFWASCNGHVEVVEMLLQANADPRKCSKDNVYPLHEASVNGHVEVVRRLLESEEGVEILNEKEHVVGATSLALATMMGHRMVVEVVLAAGTDQSMCDDFGTDARQLAILNRRVDILKCLNDFGPDT